MRRKLLVIAFCAAILAGCSNSNGNEYEGSVPANKEPHSTVAVNDNYNETDTVDKKDPDVVIEPTTQLDKEDISQGTLEKESEAAPENESIRTEENDKLAGSAQQESIHIPAQSVTQTSTQAVTQPATQKPTQTPTQPATQKPTQAPTQKPTQAPAETTTQPSTAPQWGVENSVPTRPGPDYEFNFVTGKWEKNPDPEKYSMNIFGEWVLKVDTSTKEFRDEIAYWVHYYINQFRAEEGMKPLIRSDVYDRYCQIRAEKIHEYQHWGHIKEDEEAAVAQVADEYGITVRVTEAIGAGMCELDPEAWGRKLAEGYRRSKDHWAYLGQQNNSLYFGVATYKDKSCLCVGSGKELQ